MHSHGKRDGHEIRREHCPLDHFLLDIPFQLGRDPTINRLARLQHMLGFVLQNVNVASIFQGRGRDDACAPGVDGFGARFSEEAGNDNGCLGVC